MADQDHAPLARAIRLGAAPVLEGIKATNLLCLSRHGGRLDAAWDDHGPAVARSLDLEYRVLHRSPVSTQVLFFRDRSWEPMLRQEPRQDFLRRLGYEGRDPACLFEEFCARCRGGVPHEVGCFLDYPVADVRGFIEHRGKGGLFVGWWRVYADPAGARRQFRAMTEARRAHERALSVRG